MKEFLLKNKVVLFALFCYCSGLISSCTPGENLPTPSLTPTFPMTALPSSTNTCTITPSLTISPTLTFTLTITPSPSLTYTPSPSSTNTPSPTPTNTITPTLTNTISLTPTNTTTLTPINITIFTPTGTPTSASIIVSTGDIRITRLFYDGVVSDKEPDEYVEIKNFDTNSIQLQSWSLRDLADHIYWFPSFVIEPNQTCRIYTDEIHEDSCSFNYSSPQAIWNNSGDTAFLEDSTGTLIDEYKY